MHFPNVHFRPVADTPEGLAGADNVRGTGVKTDSSGGIVREAIGDAVGATARFIFKAVIWDFVLFQLGRAVLLTATLGRYPTNRDCAQSRGRIQLVGIASLGVLWVAIAAFNNLSL